MSDEQPKQNEETGVGFTFVSLDGRASIQKAVQPVGPQSPALWRGDITDLTQSPENTAGAGDLVLRRPESVEDFYRAYRLSAVLGPIIAALTTNVYQAPHGFIAPDGIDVDDEDELRSTLKSYLAYERSGGDLEKDDEPTDDEVTTELERFRTRYRNETLFLKSWVKCCCLDMTFYQLRILTGQDLEVQGSAFWEVLRDAMSRPSRIAWCPAWSIHAQAQEAALRRVSELQPVTPIHWIRGEQLRRFRSYVQVDAAGRVVAHFKEYGDPRVMSRRTGKYYASLEDLQKAALEQPSENGAQPATEILQFKIPNAASWTYGKPDWSPAYPNIAGSRDLEEMNMKVITDQVIPQLMLLISGGRGVKKEDQERLTQQIEQNVKENRRGIYILHALPSASASGGRSTDVSMHLERLKSEQHQDALGLSYLKHSRDTARGAVRLPKVAVGDEEGINRATAGMLLRLAENQVYEPKREIFDDTINSTLIRDLGIQCVRYRTLSRVPRDPAEVTDMLTKLTSVGILAQVDGIGVAEEVLGRQFKKAKGLWSKITPRILTALLQTKNQAIAAALLSEEGDVEKVIREALLEQIASGGAGGEGGDSGSSDVGQGGRTREDGDTSSNAGPDGDPETGAALGDDDSTQS